MTDTATRRSWVWLLVPMSTALLCAEFWNRNYTRRIDFHIYYEALQFGDHNSLYNYLFPYFPLGFTYPPFAAVVMRPLSQLDRLVAEKLWLVTAAVLSAAFLCLIIPLLDWKPTWRRLGIPLTVAASLWFVPITLTVSIGQINAFIAVAIAIDVVLLHRHSRWTGLGIGFAAAMKLTPGILIPFLILAGRRREAALSAGSFVAFSAVGALVRPHDSWRFWTTELWATDRVGPYDSTMNNSIRRAVTWTGASDRVQFVLWALLAVCFVGLGLRRALAAHRNGNTLIAVTLMMLASYVVSPITWAHHLYFVIPAVLAWLMTTPRWVAAVTALPFLWAVIDPIQIGLGELAPIPRMIVLVILLVFLPTSKRYAIPGEPTDAPVGAVPRDDQFADVELRPGQPASATMG